MPKLTELTNVAERVESLKELADILAQSIEECDSKRDLAALSRQYRDTLREIDEIEGGVEVDDGITVLIQKHKK